MSGLDQISTLDSIIDLGNSYTDQEKLSEAESLYKYALEGYRKSLGQNAISALKTLDCLGIIYSAADKPEKAK